MYHRSERMREVLDQAKNLTQYETKGLAYYYNLADAHTHQRQSATQDIIITRLPELFRDAENRKQPDLDRALVEAYHRLSFQYRAIEVGGTLICYSASLAMEIVANYLRRHHLSTALIEPTFDNIADILKRHEIHLEPLSDGLLNTEDFIAALADFKTEAILLTLPNNPTGTFLTKERFQLLVNFCVEQSKLLIIDTCFRLFEPSFCYDQYQILQDAGARYIVMEDTGKVWPTLDLKVGFLNSSKDIQSELEDIHTDLLLNVSPFILRLLLEYCADSKADNFQSIRRLIENNRAFLRSQISDCKLALAYEHSHISVELLKISSLISAKDIQSYLASHGIFVLPGTYFYWNSPHLGDSFIRIALARDPKMFQEAVLAMTTALKLIS
jgi:aspartate/methionine/tyrosine aminotransferase